jgi:Na+-driven multidrug efflux pump
MWQSFVTFHLKTVFITKKSFIFYLQFIALTQPINALAFVFDGVNYGASDFAYAAYSMASQQPIVRLFAL